MRKAKDRPKIRPLVRAGIFEMDLWQQPRFIETIPGQGYKFIGNGDQAGDD